MKSPLDIVEGIQLSQTVSEKKRGKEYWIQRGSSRIQMTSLSSSI